MNTISRTGLNQASRPSPSAKNPSKPALLAAALLLAVSVPAQATPLDATFVKLVDTATAIPQGTGNFIDFMELGLSSQDLAFYGLGSGTQAGVYTIQNGSLSVIANQDTPLPGLSPPNNHLVQPGMKAMSLGFSFQNGNLAFGFIGIGSRAQAMNFPTLFSQIDGSLAAVDATPPLHAVVGNAVKEQVGLTPVYGFSFDGHAVAFGGALTDTVNLTSSWGVFRWENGSVTPLVTDQLPLPDYSGGEFANGLIGIHNLSLNQNQLALIATDVNGGGGVYLMPTTGGTATTLATTQTAVPGGGGSFGQFGEVRLSGGQVAFYATNAAGDPGIYLWSNGTLTALVNPASVVPGETNPVLSSTDTLAAFSFDHGSLAFQKNGLNQGIYTNLTGSLEKLIDVNNTLDGKTITYLQFSAEGLSGNSLAFVAYFTDGTGGIYRADIANAVPLPPAAWLFASAAGLLGTLRRKKP